MYTTQLDQEKFTQLDLKKFTQLDYKNLTIKKHKALALFGERVIIISSLDSLVKLCKFFELIYKFVN